MGGYNILQSIPSLGKVFRTKAFSLRCLKSMETSLELALLVEEVYVTLLLETPFMTSLPVLKRKLHFQGVKQMQCLLPSDPTWENLIFSRKFLVLACVRHFAFQNKSNDK